MSDPKDIQDNLRAERRSEKTGKYKLLRRTKQTEDDVLRIFRHGTERDLMQFLRENGVKDGSPRFAEIVKLFRERGGKLD